MNAYRQFWLLTALLLSAAIYSIYAGTVSWAMSKFPDLPLQLVFASVLVVFVWTYAGAGHRAARMAWRNDKMLRDLKRHDVLSSDSEAFDLLYEAKMLREEIQLAGLSDSHYSTLYERQLEHFEGLMTADISAIDGMKSNLFILGVFLAFLSISSGVGVSVLPKTIEDLHPFLFGLIRSLGLAYVPGLACVGSLLIFNYLQGRLQPQMDLLKRDFDLAVFRVAIIGTGIKESLVTLGGARAPSK